MKDSNGWEIIHTYSTKEAVADGFLVKVDSSASKEAGIKFPVYLTCAVWDKYVEVPKGMEEIQDISGRLWDILYMFTYYARKGGSGGLMTFKFSCSIPNTGNWEEHECLEDRSNKDQRLVTLKATCQAQDFDDPSPAIFIMKPKED
jgi:hypothetical protein